MEPRWLGGTGFGGLHKFMPPTNASETLVGYACSRDAGTGLGGLHKFMPLTNASETLVGYACSRDASRDALI